MFFYKNPFNTVDHLLCNLARRDLSPRDFNMSYNLLSVASISSADRDLMCSTEMAEELVLYKTKMYFIPLLEITGKRLV